MSTEFVEIILSDDDQCRRSAEWYGDAHYSDHYSDVESLNERRIKPKQKSKPAKSQFSAPLAPVAAEIKLLQLQLIGETVRENIWAIHARIHQLQNKLRKMLRARLYDKTVTMDDFSCAAPLLSECQYAGLIAFDFRRYIFGRDKEVWEFASLRDAVLSLIESKHPSNYPASIAHRKIVTVRGNAREPGCAHIKILERTYYPPLTRREFQELRDDGCEGTIAVADTTQFLIACTKQGEENAYESNRA